MLQNICFEFFSQVLKTEKKDCLLRPIKFIYSEKAKKFCEIFTLLLTVCNVVKSKVKILQDFVAFSEYMNFTTLEEKIKVD